MNASGSEGKRTPARPRRRGRPRGSVSLTAEREELIVAAVRAGATMSAAAGAAGVPVRTLYDWLARGEGRHPSRSCTPKLRRFAARLRQAEAEARISAEMAVREKYPKYWLAHRARSAPGVEGWTELPEGDAGGRDPLALPDEELDAQVAELLAEALASGALVLPPCSRPRCRCPYHEEVPDAKAS